MPASSRARARGGADRMQAPRATRRWTFSASAARPSMSSTTPSSAAVGRRCAARPVGISSRCAGRPRAGEPTGEDRWLVKTANGHQFTFVTLRELQRAILAHQVSRNDLLRRAGAPPRPLGFDQRARAVLRGTHVVQSAPAAADPEDAARSGPVRVPEALVDHLGDRSADGPQSAAIRHRLVWPGPAADAAQDRHACARPGGRPLRRRRRQSSPQPIVAGDAATPRSRWRSTRPRPRSSASRTCAAVAPRRPRPGDVVVAARRRRGRCVTRRRAASPTSPRCARSIPSSALEEPYSMRRGRRVGGWIVALVLLLAVGVLGWAVARPYIVARNASAAAQLDPRAESFLARGREGDGAMATSNRRGSRSTRRARSPRASRACGSIRRGSRPRRPTFPGSS